MQMLLQMLTLNPNSNCTNPKHLHIGGLSITSADLHIHILSVTIIHVPEAEARGIESSPP